jgi:hypothetical protein
MIHLTDAEYARLLPARDTEIPPGLRVPARAEFEQLLNEPSTTSTAGPYVGGFLCIGYRSIPLTEDEAAAFFTRQALEPEEERLDGAT